MKIQELHALLRKEMTRMVENAECAPTTLPGSPFNSGPVTSTSLASLNNEAKYYSQLWARLAQVCVKKYGADSASWPENAVRACELLGLKAKSFIGTEPT